MQASPAAPASTPAVEADTGAAPLRSLPLQRRASQSGPLAPRAALPASTSRPAQAAPALHAVPALPAKPESTEPVPDQALADKLLRERQAARMGRMWGRMATDFAPLLTVYRAKLDKHANGGQLVEALFKATESVRGMPTGVAEARHFRVKLHDDLPELNVLVWGSGIHSTLTLAKTDGAVEIKRVATRLAKSGKDGVARTLRASKMPATDGVYAQFGVLWKRLRRHAEFNEVLAAWHKQPGNAKAGEYRVLQHLVDLMDESKREPTGRAGIDKATVQVPRMERRIGVLRRRDAEGKVTDMRIVPADEGKLGYLLDKMEVAAKRSDTLRSRRHTAPTAGTGLRYRGAAAPLKEKLGQEFDAFRNVKVQAHEAAPGWAAFARHLDKLCENDAGAVVVDEVNDIRRHVVTPEGGSSPVTLLRHASDGALVLRAVKANLDDQEATLNNMRARMRGNATLAKNRQEMPATAVTAAADTQRATAAAGANAVPQGGAVLKGAHQLVQVLELVLENRQEGRRPLHGVASATGLPDAELRRWVDPGGRLLHKTPSTFVRLSGYFEARDELAGLLNELGSGGLQLPPPPTVADVVQVLEAKRNDGDAMLAKLARTADLNPRALLRFFAANGQLTASNQTLGSLPDYGEHKAALQSALAALGEVDRALHLPDPESPAETFLRNLQDVFYPVRLAIADIQHDPTLPVLEAAKRASAWREVPELLKQLVGPGNKLREPADIAADMPGMDAAQRQRLERLLQGLTGERSGPELTERLMPKRGQFPAKVFLVNNSSKVGKRASLGTSLGAMYAHSPGLIVGPRSFKQARKTQALRWLSTVLRSQVPAAREVQAYWDARHGEIWVASNVAAANTDIERLLSNGGLTETLAAVPQKSSASREARQTGKLRKVLVDGKPGHAQAKDVLEAMAQGRFRVCTGEVIGAKTGLPVDLHAERRIKRAFESAYRAEELTLDRSLVAGTMRPCAICAKDLGLSDDVRRGPFWISRAGDEGYDMAAVVREYLDASIGTYISKSADDKLNAAYNTDSDSDLEEPARAQQRAKRKPEITQPAPAKRAAVQALDGPHPVQPSAVAASTPDGSAAARKPLVRDFVDAYLGRAESNPLAARTALKDRVLGQLQAFNERAWDRPAAYESLDTVLDNVHRETGADIARAIRVGGRLGLSELPRMAQRLTVEARQQQVEALKVDTLDAWRLLAPLGVPLPRDIALTPAQIGQMLPISSQQTRQVGEAQVQQALQALMDEGSRRFGDFMARQREQPGVQPAPEEKIVLAEISRQSAMLRHSAAVLGWLPPQASPTHPLPPHEPPSDGDWRVQAQQLFIRGSASGAGNICWFDTLAQLSLDQARDLGGDHYAVKVLARSLRQASDLLGLSSTGEQFDDAGGAMHLIARFLRVQVHAFRSHPEDGSVGLFAAQSIGSPTDRPVYLHTDDNHFEPMWPNWEQ